VLAIRSSSEEGAGEQDIIAGSEITQAFPNAGKSRGMSDHRIAGNVLGKDGALQEGFRLKHQLFDTAVLETQLYFEVQYLFAVAYKPEMTGLNNSGMDRPYTHLMQLTYLVKDSSLC
jgi:hypothetical protein